MQRALLYILLDKLGTDLLGGNPLQSDYRAFASKFPK
jgi:hypothetical protein